MMRRVPSVEKLHALTGFRPHIPLNEIIDRVSASFNRRPKPSTFTSSRYQRRLNSVAWPARAIFFEPFRHFFAINSHQESTNLFVLYQTLEIFFVFTSSYPEVSQ